MQNIFFCGKIILNSSVEVVCRVDMFDFNIDFFMNLVYFMQAFERRKIFYLFPLFTT